MQFGISKRLKIYKVIVLLPFSEKNKREFTFPFLLPVESLIFPLLFN